ncbi:MAG: hypothetical protein ABSD61_12700 [Terracidiphilus sp.]|jgi:hypothetical protein
MTDHDDPAKAGQIRPATDDWSTLFFTVFLAFAIVEAEYVIDLVSLFKYHTHFDLLSPVWVYELMVLASFGGFLRARRNRGKVRIKGELRDYSATYFSMAVFFLLLSTLMHREFVAAVIEARYRCGP